MNVDPTWHKQKISDYAKELRHYRTYKEVLERVLKGACELYAPRAVVEARAKTISSFAEKAVRKYQKYKDPLNEFCDLAGARVIVFAVEQVDAICRFIEGHFVVLEKEDMMERLREAEFGYRSIHYTVQVSSAAGLGISAAERKRIGSRKAEIQVRTFLQHAWADVLHDRVYKTEISVPREYKRDAGRVAAIMEEGDQTISRFIENMDAYLLHYSAYMDPERMQSEISTLALVLDHEPEPSNKPCVALRLAKVAASAGQWGTVADRLEEYVDVLSPVQDEMRVLYGAALCKQFQGRPNHPRFREGQKYLRAIAPCGDHTPDCLVCRQRNPLRATALSWLAWSTLQARRDGVPGRARELYYRAYQCDPDNPYNLARFLECEALHSHTTDFAGLSFPQIADAIDKCEEHVRVRVQLPEAFWALGNLRILAGRVREGLLALAQGIAASNTEEPIREEWRRMVAMQEHVPGLRDALEIPRQFLLLGVIGKLYGQLSACRQRAKEKKTKHDEALRQEAQGQSADVEAIRQEYGQATAEVKKANRKLNWALDHAFAPAVGAGGRRRRAPGVLAYDPKACEEFRRHLQVQTPIVFIAGGADPRLEKHLGDYRGLLSKALSGFPGIVFSGGTDSGIPGLLGEIAETQRRKPGRSLWLYGYLPRKLPADARRDRRYTRTFRTEDEGFSCRQPVQNWIDLMSLRVNPADVHILGINGGDIAEFEYHLGLALGATVALVEGSGRKAADMLGEEPWSKPGQLLQLPHDSMSARAFLFTSEPPMEKPEFERAAERAHEDYRKFSSPQDPSMLPWDKLPLEFRLSSFHQVAYAGKILQTAGLRLRGVTDPSRGVENMRELVEDGEIRRMAEMEHGRWVMERLMQGWKYGKLKDVARKTSPYLVPWRNVPPHIQQYDVRAIENMPAFLKTSGWEVYKP